MRTYHVYIMTNKPRGVLYTGVTNALARRVKMHKDGTGSQFTAHYSLKRLVYAEEYTFIEEAIKREKQLKNWHRAWKIELIEQVNPMWNDLFEVL